MHTEYEFLKRLSDSFGPSGCEDHTRELIKKHISPSVNKIRVDAMGNLIAIKYDNPENSVLIASHIDEVGFIIDEITDEGTLKFQKIGGIDNRMLPYKKVRILTCKNRLIPGVINYPPVHLKDKNTNVLSYEKLEIDIGTKDKKHAEKVVSVGDYGSFLTESYIFGNIFRGKALDDRIGCYMLTELLCSNIKNLYGIFTTQEEVGTRGIAAAIHNLKSGAAIILEGTTSADLPLKREFNVSTLPGQGPAISVVDRTTISDPDLVKLFKTTAKKHGIPLQVKRTISGGTDARVIQKSGSGVRVITLSIPVRYIHSNISQIDLNDVKSALKLLKIVIPKILKS